MSGLPKVWEYSKGPRISIESHHQAMAIQGLGQALCSVDKKMKVRIMNKEDVSDPKVHHITSEVGRKSGINSAQNTWTGSLKM
jgi:hypothetical protein